MILVLFDVDGTLIHTNGAGIKAFRRAMYDVFDLRVEKTDIRPDGKTDPLILKEFLEYHKSAGRWSRVSEKKLFARYIECLKDEMALVRRSGRARVLPGVRELLDVLSGTPDFAVGLATGNIESGAATKLEGVGLDGYFHFGGFGSDSENRTELTRIGIQRGKRFVAPESVERSFVVGDTPFDIVHGREAGAAVIAVASGNYGLGDLADHSPDWALPDLTSTERIVAFMRGKTEDGAPG